MNKNNIHFAFLTLSFHFRFLYMVVFFLLAGENVIFSFYFIDELNLYTQLSVLTSLALHNDERFRSDLVGSNEVLD